MSANRFVFYKGLKDLILIYPIYTLLFDEAGLLLPQISILLALWSLPVVVLEIPSGILSDRWSRRGMIIIASVLKALCFLLWLIFPSFLFFALGFLCWGVSEAFASGSEEALLFDSLMLKGKSDSFESVYARGAAASSIAVAISCFSGGFIAQMFGFELVLSLSILSCIATVMIALSFKEINLNCAQRQQSSSCILREALQHILHTPHVLAMAALLVLPIALGGILDEYDPLIASSYNIPLTFVGFWVGGRYLLEGLGSALAPYFRQKSLLLCFLAGFSLLFSSLFSSIYVLGFYFLFFMFLSSASVIQENKIQMSIAEQGRATVHSLISMAVNLHAIIVFALLHFLDDLSHILLFFSVYCLLASFVIGLFKQNANPVQESRN